MMLSCKVAETFGKLSVRATKACGVVEVYLQPRRQATVSCQLHVAIALTPGEVTPLLVGEEAWWFPHPV